MREPQLDDIDRAIMALLREDGRRPYRDLSQATGLSETAVRHRVARMVRSGVFRITILTDATRLGLVTAEIRIRVATRPASDVAAAVATLPEVDFVAVCAGPDNVVASVICRDNEHLVGVLDRVLAIDGVQGADTVTFVAVVKNALGW